MKEINIVREIIDRENIEDYSIDNLNSRMGFNFNVKSPEKNYLLKLVPHKETDSALMNRVSGLKKEANILINIFKDRNGEIKYGKYKNYYWLMREWHSGDDAGLKTKYIRKDKGNKLNQLQFLNDVEKMIHAILKVHSKNYLHGDLQINHFIFSSEDKVNMIDFECAYDMENQYNNYEGALVHYVSPEVASSMLKADKNIILNKKSEVYSFGIVLYILLTGKVPYDYESYIKENDSKKGKLLAVSNGIEIEKLENELKEFPDLFFIVEKCLKFNPSDRYNNFDELLNDVMKAKKCQLTVGC